MNSWKEDIKLILRDLDEDFEWSKRYPEWILAGIALAVILVLLFDPFNAL